MIIPARDAAATLPRTLAALAAQDGIPELEVIVVDDGSGDATAQVASQTEGVEVLHQDAEGPSVARNRGAERARGRLLAFLDADCFPVPGWAAAGVRALGRAELVQGAVAADPQATLGPFDRSLWVTSERGFYESANLFVTREAFERVAGFEEWIRPTTGKAIAEDLWFGWRLRRTGAPTTFSQEALVYHAVFPRLPREFVAERRRLRYFPAIARQVPEMRRETFFARAFLDERSAAFDAMLAGVVLAGARRWPLALGLAIPYARRLRHAGSPKVATWQLAADATGFAELLHGSLRYRSLLL